MTMPDDTIRVWSIQRPGWYALLQHRGVLSGDGRRPWRELRPAYRWLMGQMRRRIPGYRGGWPVWFWCTRPDLRRTAHLPKGERGVCLELELPRSRVLLLDFQAWHCVLNPGYLAYSEDEPESDDPAVIEQSWERVFELDKLRQSGYWGPVDQIQGVIEHVHVQQVRAVQEFLAR